MSTRTLPRPSRTCVAAILCCVLAVTTEQAYGQAQAAPSVILLRNGQVLHGQVTLYGDRYLIALPHGEVRIPRKDIEQVCGSLDEAYRHKRNAVRFGSASEHMQLAQWCLDQDLMDEASEQWEIALGLDPRHPKLGSIMRQLERARDKKSRRTAQRPLRPSPVRSEELDSLVRSLPPRTVEMFTKSIQPMISNGCSARACHGSATKSDFRWIQTGSGRLPPRRVTLRNLHAVIPWVNRNDPTASPILRAASEPHGGRDRILFPSGSVPYARLVAWVGLLGNGSPKVALRDSEAPAQPPTSAQERSRVPSSQALHNQMATPSQGAEATRRVLSESGAQPRTPRETPFRPKDPFDPNAFNRRYHPKSP